MSGDFSIIDVLAHFASAYWDERVALAEVDAVRVLRQVGLHRVMFGSDAPGSDVSWQAFQAVRLPLTPVEQRGLLAGRARKVFGLT